MDIQEIIKNELTEEQQRSAVDSSQEVLTIACAGSGKSRTLAYRIARLLADGETPESIVAFTFTEKAAESIKRRVSQALQKVGLDSALIGAMYIGTIHSFCQHILGESDAIYRQYDVLDKNRLIIFLIANYHQLKLHLLRNQWGTKYFETIEQLADAWTTAHDERLSIADIKSSDSLLGQTLENLNDMLKSKQFIDFSLMIRLVVDALYNNDKEYGLIARLPRNNPS